MEIALIVHTEYDRVCVVLMLPHAPLIASIPKHAASGQLISVIATLLEKAQLSLKDCGYVAAHQGPGPFTTLRTSLATVNGIAYATSLPLIGVDGLDAFLQQEAPTCTTRYLGIILNAFTHDVYYALYDTTTGATERGCLSIDAYGEWLASFPQKSVTLVGNGVSLHREVLEHTCGKVVVIPHIIPDLASWQAIATCAHELWRQGKTHKQLLPLYLKNSSAVMGQPIPGI